MILKKRKKSECLTIEFIESTDHMDKGEKGFVDTDREKIINTKI
jgi:hypothetical protein